MTLALERQNEVVFRSQGRPPGPSPRATDGLTEADIAAFREDAELRTGWRPSSLCRSWGVAVALGLMLLDTIVARSVLVTASTPDVGR